MTKKIKVSIVIPVYNQEEYLDTSLSSVISQTYSNLEVIVVNDGSTDTSRSIIENYSQFDARIKVIDKPNGGLVDATLTGLQNTTGDYVAFLDPDDRIGEDFVENFVSQITDDFDMISMGYYLDRAGELIPKYLKESRIYSGEELDKLGKMFLYEKGEAMVSNRFFISRWNKLYKMSMLNKIFSEFEKCRNISLGEDSMFTSLALQASNSVKVISSPNSYFYNIANQNSMMKTGALISTLEKSKLAYEKLLEVLPNNQDQAMALYFFLIENFFQRLKVNDRFSFKQLFKILKKDNLYQSSLKFILKHTTSKPKKLELISRRILGSYGYIFLNLSLAYLKEIAKFTLKELPKFLLDTKKSGLDKAKKLAHFRRARKTAFNDIDEKLPIIEKQIDPLISKYLNQKTNLSKSPICKNIFVFWWDGFENAPKLVQRCLESVIKYNPSANIIKISEQNFREYTKIDSKIIDEFYKGNISIQTFSDILRFNLLMNNGGVWIDATILFLNEFDLFKGLENKSFNSLSFSSSKNFLKYKDEECSWSGYFIASRKNGHFVTVMNNLFQEYFLIYKNYPIYFFIDALFILCKINKIDDDVLSKTDSVFGDMFLLSKLYNEDYNNYSLRLIKRVPQKLSWSHSGDMNLKNSFFNKLGL
ncbi:TPA: glycosyltransferase [Streptococcus suis]|nr:glycosyltransferase [Streptococcus suis]